MPGKTAFANQLDAPPDNTLASVLSQTPLADGTQFRKLYSLRYHIYPYTNGTWSPLKNSPVEDDTLSPGEGAWINNPTANSFTVTFVGSVREGQLTIPLTGTNAIHFVSSMVPQAGGLVSDLGCQLRGGETVQLLANSNSPDDFYIYSYCPGLQAEGYPSDWIDWYGVPIPGGIYDPDSDCWFVPEPHIGVGESFWIEKPNSDETWSQTFSVCN